MRAELEAAAQRRIAAGQLELGLGLEPAGGGRLPITSSRMGAPAGCPGARMPGAGARCRRGQGRRVPGIWCLRVIELVSKLDSLRVLEEAGVTLAWYATVKRRLPEYAQEQGRQRLPAHVPISFRASLITRRLMSIRRGISGWPVDGGLPLRLQDTRRDREARAWHADGRPPRWSGRAS